MPEGQPAHLQFDEWSRKDLDEYQTGRAPLSSLFVVCLERLNTCWVCLKSIIYIYIHIHSFVRSFIHSCMYSFIFIHVLIHLVVYFFLSLFLSFFLSLATSTARTQIRCKLCRSGVAFEGVW